MEQVYGWITVNFVKALFDWVPA